MKKLLDRAKQIRQKYKQLEKKKYGRNWTAAEIAQGFVGDVGDLQKLVMAKSGIRDVENVDQKLAHELADCLWSILILADEYDIDLETAFEKSMDELEEKLNS